MTVTRKRCPFDRKTYYPVPPDRSPTALQTFKITIHTQFIQESDMCKNGGCDGKFLCLLEDFWFGVDLLLNYYDFCRWLQIEVFFINKLLIIDSLSKGDSSFSHYYLLLLKITSVSNVWSVMRAIQIPPHGNHFWVSYVSQSFPLKILRA